MFASLVDINGNVNDCPAAAAAQARAAELQQEPSLMMQLQMMIQQLPSERLEDCVLGAFFEFGLVEVLLEQDGSLVWHDAYIINVAKTAVAESGPEGTLAPQNEAGKTEAPCKHTCTVVLAIQGEEPGQTLTEAKNIQVVFLEQVRLKLKFDDQTAFSDNEMVQIFMEESKPFVKWLPGKIIKVAKGDFFVVNVVNVAGKPDSSLDATEAHDLSKLDFVSKDCLRPQNSYYQLSEANNPFYRFDLLLSKDFLHFIRNNFKWLANYELHKDFKKYIPQLISVFPDPEKKSLTCIAFFSNENLIFKEQVVKRANMLSSMHFNRLRDSFAFACQMGTITPSEPIVSEKPKDFRIRLHVDKKYVALSIGKKGANIQAARRLEGITSLELDDATSVFYIRGVSQEAVNAAAEMLNYVERVISYPIDYLQLFYDSKIIDEMVNVSGVVRVELFDPRNDDNEIHIFIVGKPITLENFQVIFEFQKADQDEINQFKYQYKMLMQQLCNMQQEESFPPKNFADAVKLGNKQ